MSYNFLSGIPCPTLKFFQNFKAVIYKSIHSIILLNTMLDYYS